MPESVIHEANIEYSNVGGKVEMADRSSAAPPLAEPRPAVLLIHGGGFRVGNRQSYLPEPSGLLKGDARGDGELSARRPRINPAPVDDVKAAVRFLRANAANMGLISDRIGAIGAVPAGTWSCSWE